MKKLPLILLLVIGVLIATRPANLARIQGVIDIVRELGSEAHSAFVDEPIAQSKEKFRKELEQQAKEEAEARFKQIDEAVDRSLQGKSK